MNKQQQIEKYLAEPIKVGDKVYIRGLGTQSKDAFFNTTHVLAVQEDGETIEILEYSYSKSHTAVKKEDYKKYTDTIGVNPFPNKRWDSSLRSVAFTLNSIVNDCGFDRVTRTRKTEQFGEVEVNEMEWNPYFIIDGKEVEYQRDFCWELKDKQLLIESIYNGVDIGKIVIRKRDYHWVQQRVEKGQRAAFKDVVDGKQRLNAIIGFMSGEFMDLHGNYFDDLSLRAQYEFGDFLSVSYGEIGESATDEDVKAVFLGVNFTGVPMSAEHVEYVKNIKL